MIGILIVFYMVLLTLASAAPEQTSSLVLTLAYRNDILSPSQGGVFCDLLGFCP